MWVTKLGATRDSAMRVGDAVTRLSWPGWSRSPVLARWSENRINDLQARSKRGLLTGL